MTGGQWPPATRADVCPDPSLCARRAVAHVTALRTVNMKHGGLAIGALILAQRQFVRSSASVRPGDILSRARRGLNYVTHKAPRQYK
ncbi:hypothetical protein SVAN01_07867 [Stagonosporopsis vannaccii]|nr:hypothetical protein SVAN01_07867 [Stagonosporopsis vannaccii]